MMSINVVNIRDVIDGYDLTNKRVQLGVKRGLAKIGSSVKTKGSALIRQAYNLKKSDLDQSFTVFGTSDQVSIICASRPVNLTRFGAVQYGVRKGKQFSVKRSGDALKHGRGKGAGFGGVKVTIRNGVVTMLTGAFLQRMANGNIGVFTRADHARKSARFRPRKTSRPYDVSNRPKVKTIAAIVNMASVTPSTMFGGQRVMPQILDYVSSPESMAILTHEIEWAERSG
jgi:hypothetical protein